VRWHALVQHDPTAFHARGRMSLPVLSLFLSLSVYVLTVVRVVMAK
jgi:hypothetical protein